MAGGWAKDGAVNEQIEASIGEELARLRLRNRSGGESRSQCVECDEPIPEARRTAIPGVTLCRACQEDRDRAFRQRPGINRRGSKDSQLK